MKLKIAGSLLFLLLSLPAAAQNGDQTPKISLPENVMAQVVRRILGWKFAPSKRPKTVLLSGRGVKKEWLPAIANVEFRLLTEDEVRDAKTGIYFFTAPEKEGKTYNLGLGFGDPGCDYTGETWYFRPDGAKIRLWKHVGRGFGGGCGGFRGSTDGPPGELNKYPNELAGYEFFDRGKLKGLKLTVSTREDVRRALGDDCEKSCDLDANWEIGFDYFGETSRGREIGGKTVYYVAAPEVTGRLFAFYLRPKKPLSFDRIVFPRQFGRAGGYVCLFSGDGRGTSYGYDSHTDRYGLEYRVSVGIGSTTEKKPLAGKGFLIDIEYRIPSKLEEKMFVPEK
ncbi:MAG: hypothetical protein JSS81_11405 [Acidobacteria bacterium]|nr:hypothetical protein [Acidobacteriota bacterium]